METTQEELNLVYEFENNISVINREIEWFSEILDKRFLLYFDPRDDDGDIYNIEPPTIEKSNAPYARVVNHYNMQAPERLTMLMSFLPHIKPEVLDLFLIQNENINRPFTEFGGIIGMSHGGFLPTGETVMFLLAGYRMEKRLLFQNIFSQSHYFYKHNILSLTNLKTGEPTLSGALTLSKEYVDLLTTGRPFKPLYTSQFPAKLVSTPYEWNDLVLEENAMEQVREIIGWIKYGNYLLKEWELEKKIRPGFTSLFYGPPGTGKTLTACLLGKTTGLDIFKIDLSMMISKYIGETEKNLANVFDQAENKNWILFFDEADSLFSARTEANTANDRSANQQVSYLLQRIEDFTGVVILATNLKANIDAAFLRRFQSIIPFTMPGVNERLKLWVQCFENKNFIVAKDVDFHTLAENYELAGGNIINILRFCCIQSVIRDSNTIALYDIKSGIRKEFGKIGKTLGRS